MRYGQYGTINAPIFEVLELFAKFVTGRYEWLKKHGTVGATSGEIHDVFR